MTGSWGTHERRQAPGTVLLNGQMGDGLPTPAQSLRGSRAVPGRRCRTVSGAVGPPHQPSPGRQRHLLPVGGTGMSVCSLPASEALHFHHPSAAVAS